MTIIVGLTGGIASGKSFVVDYLHRIKIPTHDSDKVVKKIYLKPTYKFFSYLKKNGFNKAIVKSKINKNIIREEIFNNHTKRKKLEKYIHFYIKTNRDQFIKKNKNQKIIFLDIPLLFEKKLQSNCHYICSVIAPLKVREKRALQRTGITKEIFKLIKKTQTNDKIRRANSDYIINSHIAKKKTYLQIENIIYDILEKNK